MKQPKTLPIKMAAPLGVASGDLLADTHRIVTNGLKFKIQERITKGWWLWKREVWCDLGKNYGGCYFAPTTYDKIGEAQKLCDKWNHEDAMRHEWRAVSANDKLSHD